MITNKILNFFIAIIFSITICPYAFSQPNWLLINISKPLNSIHFPTHQTGYIFGSSIRLKTSDAGAVWSYSLNDPNIGLSPDNSIFFIDSLNGWAAQYNWDLFKTTNGGITWLNVPVGLVVYTYSVMFTDALTGWSGNHDRNILKTNSGGSNWYRINTGFDKDISSFHFIDNSTGFVTFSFIWSNIDSFAITTNGGAIWTKKMHTAHHGPSKVYFADHEHGWMLCLGNYMLRTTNSGQNWDGYSVPMGYPNKIFFIDNLTGFVLENYSSGCKISKSTDGGVSWEFVKNTEGSLDDIYFIDSDKGYAVGSEGIIYNTTDQGNNWGFDSSKFRNEEMISVSFSNRDTGWSCTSTKIYKSTNSGHSWSTNYRFSGFYINEIYAINENNVIAIGTDGKILKTTNGGLNWNTEVISVAGNSLNSVYFIDSNTGWIAGQAGLIMHSTNSGLNWSVQNSNTTKKLNSVKAIDKNNCFVVGDSGIILNTTNMGTSWNQRILNDKTLRSVTFINDSTGFITSNKSYYLWFNYNFESIIYRTSDKGVSWTPVYTQSDVNRNTFINSISFLDSTFGTVTGNGNVILRSLNGGQNWTQVNVNVQNVNFLDLDFKSDVGFIVGSNGCLLTTDNISTVIFSYSNAIPEEFFLFQNYPNPFNPVTLIYFQLPKDVNVKIKVYDISGREIKILINEFKVAGSYNVSFDGTNLSSGAYFYRIEAGDFVQTKRMVLIK